MYMVKNKGIKYSAFMKYSKNKQNEILHRIGLSERRRLFKLIQTGVVEPYPTNEIWINYNK